jgi:hypothetical protein
VFRDLRRSVAVKVETALKSGRFLLSLSGASLAAAFGRFLLAALLAALALGIGFRLVGRQRLIGASQSEIPSLAKAGILLVSLAEVAALVVATDTPVRFHQEAFSFAHWAWVLVAVAVVYFVQVRLFASLSQLCSHQAP